MTALAARLALATLVATTCASVGAQPSAAIPPDGCPPKGARFERPSSLGPTVFEATGGRYGFPVSGTQSGTQRPACNFTVDGKQTFATLKASDAPLDEVPRSRTGACPVGQTGRYQVTSITTYSDTILAGPDSVGRCQLKSASGALSWRYPDEFEVVQASKAAPLPRALPSGSVWTCTLPGIGLFTGANFGIIDGRSFRDQNGQRGHYTYNPDTGVLRLTHAKGTVMAYQRQSDRNFRLLDDKGQITGGNCVWNQAKDINGRW